MIILQGFLANRILEIAPHRICAADIYRHDPNAVLLDPLGKDTISMERCSNNLLRYGNGTYSE